MSASARARESLVKGLSAVEGLSLVDVEPGLQAGTPSASNTEDLQVAGGFPLADLEASPLSVATRIIRWITPAMGKMGIPPGATRFVALDELPEIYVPFRFDGRDLVIHGRAEDDFAYLTIGTNVPDRYFD